MNAPASDREARIAELEAQLAPPPLAGADTGQVPLPADTPKGNRALWWGIAAVLAALLWYWLSKQLRA